MKLSDAFEYFDTHNNGIITFDEVGRGSLFSLVPGSSADSPEKGNLSQQYAAFLHHDR